MSLRDNQLFEITEVEIARVDCSIIPVCFFGRPLETFEDRICSKSSIFLSRVRLE